MTLLNSLKRKIARMFSLISMAFLLLSKKIYLSEAEKRVIPWFEADGDRTLRLGYPLNKDSLVFDLGGYIGEWTDQIYSMYRCKIYVFEPVDQFANKLSSKYKKNSDISVFRYGLSSENRETKISLEQNSSSIYKESSNMVSIQLVNATDFFVKHKVKKIDLIKLNIEGGEYDLLDHIIEMNTVKTIRNIQVQFHDFVPDAVKRRNSIRRKLSKTHRLTYDFPFVWENWKLK
jgi:FkbM family methyltransferase